VNDSYEAISIGGVSNLIGVPAPTIRSWERRHGLPVGERTESGHRRYRSGDVAALARMRDELAAGRGAVEAAATVISSLTGTPAVLVQDLCAAAHQFDPPAVIGVLDRASLLHGVTAAIELVLFPAMRELGRQWETAEGDVAHEHLATSAIQAWLRTAGQSAPQPLAQRPVLLACGPDEQHSLALDAFAVLLARAGVRCVNLGARVPATSLVEAVTGSKAYAVVLTCQLDRNRRAAVAALRAVAETPSAVHYAGAAFAEPSSRRGVPGRYLGDDLSGAVDLVVRSGPTEGSSNGESSTSSRA
jgi:hypothetical protein